MNKTLLQYEIDFIFNNPEKFGSEEHQATVVENLCKNSWIQESKKLLTVALDSNDELATRRLFKHLQSDVYQPDMKYLKQFSKADYNQPMKTWYTRLYIKLKYVILKK